MASLFRSLIVKKYSLKPVKYQIAIQSLLIGFVCLLSILPVAINGTSIVVSVGFSTLIGVVFGLLPSISAANLNPIEALRHE